MLIKPTSHYKVGWVGDESISFSETAGSHLTHPGSVVILVVGRQDPQAAVSVVTARPLVLAGVCSDGSVVPLPPALPPLVPHPAHHGHVSPGVDFSVPGLLLPLLPG